MATTESEVQSLLDLHNEVERAQIAALAHDAHEPFEAEPAAADAPAAVALLSADDTHTAEKVAELLAIARDPRRFAMAQRTAKKRLAQWPHNGCADFQSVLLQMAGFGNPQIMLARVLGLWLEKHGWKSIPVGQQRPGDLGSTCGSAPHPGVDHIYLVMHVGHGGEMTIADNQRTSPHERWTIGHGKSPTTHFLRAI